MPRALLSVYDKAGLVELAMFLSECGWELVASGGTERELVDAGLSVTSVESLTGFGALLGGRVKTLHPAIHAGILARDTESDVRDLAQHNLAPFKLVVCNLYPFREVVRQSSVMLQDAIEYIDIGGVALVRAASKNFFHVCVVSDVNDYAKIKSALKATGDIDLSLRKELAIKSFAMTRDYDTAIHAYLSRGTTTSMAAVTDELPDQLSIGYRKIQDLRYGENAHQKAAYYSQQSSGTVLGGNLIGGKSLSYNNILDVDSAWRAVGSFQDPTVVIVKHLTPTGIASSESITAAFPAALASDPISAFGGVIAVNREVDVDFLDAVGTLFVEAIAAPSFTDAAIELLSTKRKNCRILQIPYPFDGSELEIRAVHRGVLVQRMDVGDPEGTAMKVVTTRQPSDDEMAALQFAWKAVQHVKSNAIVFAQKNKTVGVGGGLPSRVDAVRLAATKAGDNAKGAVMASDAFFPFADNIEIASAAGITAIIQPGGSIRDGEVIEAANKANIAMVFTATRHFRH